MLSVYFTSNQGFVGPSYSETAKDVAAFLNDVKVPIISPSATLPDLDNRIEYGSFLRAAISDEYQAKVCT